MTDFTGRIDIKLDLRGAKAKTTQGAREGLTDALEHLLQESRKLVPIEEGTLERSGKTSTSDDGLSGAVSYDTPYAVVQHEDMTFHHDQGRTSKYLERPMREQANTMAKIVADAIRKELG